MLGRENRQKRQKRTRRYFPLILKALFLLSHERATGNRIFCGRRHGGKKKSLSLFCWSVLQNPTLCMSTKTYLHVSDNLSCKPLHTNWQQPISVSPSIWQFTFHNLPQGTSLDSNVTVWGLVMWDIAQRTSFRHQYYYLSQSLECKILHTACQLTSVSLSVSFYLL